MALPRQTVSIPLSQGLDLQTDPKQVQLGKLLIAENAKFESNLRIKKRAGYVALPTATGDGGNGVAALNPIASGRLLATLGDRLFLGDGAQGSIYADGLWNRMAGPCAALRIGAMPVSTGLGPALVPDFDMVDAAYNNGVVGSIVRDRGSSTTGFAFFSATGALLFGPYSFPANKAKILALGPWLVLLGVSGPTTFAYAAYRADPNGVTLAASGSVAVATSGGSAAVVWDAVLVPGSPDKIVVFYADSGAGGINRISFSNVAGVFTAGTTVAMYHDSMVACGACVAPGHDIALGYHNGGNFKALTCDRDTFALTGGGPFTGEAVANPKNIAATYSGGAPAFLYDVRGTPASKTVVRGGSLVLGVLSGGVVKRSVGLASKFFGPAGDCILLGHDSPLQATGFVYRLTAGVIGKIAPRLAGPLPPVNILPEVPSLGGNVWGVPFLKAVTYSVFGAGSSTVEITAKRMGWLASVDFDAPQFAQQSANGLHLTGGCLWYTDGIKMVEHGFHLFPEGMTAVAAGGSSALTGGSYLYAATYEWTDTSGNRHRSAVPGSAQVTVTAAPGDAVTVTVPTLRVTAKEGVEIVIYRTDPNQAVLYEAARIANNVTVDSVTYLDVLASYLGNAQLYTTGGEVDHDGPPAPALVGTSSNRVRLLSSEDPYTYWSALPTVVGSPIEWSQLFAGTIEQDGGPITAWAQMDDKLVIFKGSRIYFTTGAGPAADGSSDDLQRPTPILSDAGCINPASVVVTPLGLMYQSAKGIYLLTRGGEPQYVGEEVRPFNHNAVVAAALVPDLREVRFALESGDTLVYDYYHKQWSVSVGLSAVSATVFRRRYAYLEAGGTVKQEADVFTDNGAPVNLKVQTGWISFAGLQGFQRLYRILFLGEYRSPHVLHVSVAYDFDPTIVQTETLDPLVLVGPSPVAGDRYQARIRLDRQKCESVQVTIQEEQRLPYGEGLSLSALALEVGLKSGAYKLPRGQSVP